VALVRAARLFYFLWSAASRTAASKFSKATRSRHSASALVAGGSRGSTIVWIVSAISRRRSAINSVVCRVRGRRLGFISARIGSLAPRGSWGERAVHEKRAVAGPCSARSRPVGSLSRIRSIRSVGQSVVGQGSGVIARLVPSFIRFLRFQELEEVAAQDENLATALSHFQTAGPQLSPSEIAQARPQSELGNRVSGVRRDSSLPSRHRSPPPALVHAIVRPPALPPPVPSLRRRRECTGPPCPRLAGSGRIAALTLERRTQMHPSS
jgi:hypothetical protein